MIHTAKFGAEGCLVFRLRVVQLRVDVREEDAAEKADKEGDEKS